MRSTTRPARYLRLVHGEENASILSQADFAWEVLRRRADYHAGPVPTRRAIDTPAGKRVTLIECAPLAHRSWGLLFRRGSTPRCA